MSTPTTAAPSATPATAPVTPPAQAAAPAAPAPRMMKLKVDGQDLELSEAEVITLAQQGKSSGKRFQEAATTKREAEQIIQFAKQNPTEFFAKTGMNAREWAENFLLDQIKAEQMSPEQKKAAENEKRLKQYESQEKAAKEKAHQDQMQALEQKEMQNYDQMFVKALTESGLPKTAYTVKRMAELTLVNVRKGLNLEASQLAKIVREDYIAEQKALFSAADGDALMELLGKDAVKRLSKAQISKYKASKTNNSTAPKKADSAQETKNPISAWKAMQKKTRSLI